MEKRASLMKEISSWDQGDLMKEIYIQLSFMGDKIQHMDNEKTALEIKGETVYKLLESRVATLEKQEAERIGEKKQSEVLTKRYIPVFLAVIVLIQLIFALLNYIKV